MSTQRPPLHLEISVRSATARGASALIERASAAGAGGATTLSLVLGGRKAGIRVPDVLKALPHLRSAVVLLGELAVHDPEWSATVADLVHAHVTASVRRARVIVGFLLDDRADAMAVLAGQATALAITRESSRALRAAGLHVRWFVPISSALVFRLEGLFSLARDEGVEALLVRGGLADLEENEALFARDFVRHRLLDEERSALSQEQIACYERFLDPAEPSNPKAPWPGRSERLELDGDKLRSFDSAQLDPAIASSFEALDPTGGRQRRERLVADLSEVAFEGQRALVRWARTQIQGRGRPEHGTQRVLRSVLLIGAYGGEHIGDIAILGGVLFRIHERYKTTSAILVSQRADHTRHLVPMLETPVTLSVAQYDQSTVSNHLAQVDGVVFAGGPLMDLPKQLTKHLYTVALARSAGKPFVAEGIGAGPFARRPSEWVARRLVRMAERISMRTSDDAKKPLVAGLLPERGQDPAFDYLATRPPDLTRIAGKDRPWLESLLAGTDGRITVGLNIRPIRSLFTTASQGGNRVERTLDVEERFYEQLAEGLLRFQQGGHEVTFVFFPMNAIQFGMSDLRSAYRLGRLLGSDADFRVWQGDASLDGVVALLRKLDVVVTMRFHATIFALAQQRPVIGIDYRVGQRDKVAALLDDCGQPDQYRRIDELTAGWLCDRLSEHASRMAKPPSAGSGA